MLWVHTMADKKKKSAVRVWLREHLTDPWVREAQRQGYRSRAAFKLLEVAERDRLLRPGIRVLDLGAAPGSWTQAIIRATGGRASIVCCDILPMEPVRGAAIVVGDLYDEATRSAVTAELAGAAVDLVVSDMAPNLSGVAVADQARAVGLADLALDCAGQWLAPGGDMVIKAFQGAGFDPLAREFGARFAKSYVRKPKASRDRSREVFLVGKGFRGGGQA
jgi:23S rRNA (uridine2552-2'-O)-methyltransferase